MSNVNSRSFLSMPLNDLAAARNPVTAPTRLAPLSVLPTPRSESFATNLSALQDYIATQALGSMIKVKQSKSNPGQIRIVIRDIESLKPHFSELKRLMTPFFGNGKIKVKRVEGSSSTLTSYPISDAQLNLIFVTTPVSLPPIRHPFSPRSVVPVSVGASYSPSMVPVMRIFSEALAERQANGTDEVANCDVQRDFPRHTHLCFVSPNETVLDLMGRISSLENCLVNPILENKCFGPTDVFLVHKGQRVRFEDKISDLSFGTPELGMTLSTVPSPIILPSDFLEHIDKMLPKELLDKLGSTSFESLSINFPGICDCSRSTSSPRSTQVTDVLFRRMGLVFRLDGEKDLKMAVLKDLATVHDILSKMPEGTLGGLRNSFLKKIKDAIYFGVKSLHLDAMSTVGVPARLEAVGGAGVVSMSTSSTRMLPPRAFSIDERKSMFKDFVTLAGDAVNKLLLEPKGKQDYSEYLGILEGLPKIPSSSTLTEEDKKFFIDQVEILRGQLSALFGSQSSTYYEYIKSHLLPLGARDYLLDRMDSSLNRLKVALHSGKTEDTANAVYQGDSKFLTMTYSRNDKWSSRDSVTIDFAITDFARCTSKVRAQICHALEQCFDILSGHQNRFYDDVSASKTFADIPVFLTVNGNSLATGAAQITKDTVASVLDEFIRPNMPEGPAYESTVRTFETMMAPTSRSLAQALAYSKTVEDVTPQLACAAGIHEPDTVVHVVGDPKPFSKLSLDVVSVLTGEPLLDVPFATYTESVVPPKPNVHEKSGFVRQFIADGNIIPKRLVQAFDEKQQVSGLKARGNESGFVRDAVTEAKHGQEGIDALYPIGTVERKQYEAYKSAGQVLLSEGQTASEEKLRAMSTRFTNAETDFNLFNFNSFFELGGRFINAPDYESSMEGNPLFRLAIPKGSDIISVCHEGMNRSQVAAVDFAARGLNVLAVHGAEIGFYPYSFATLRMDDQDNLYRYLNVPLLPYNEPGEWLSRTFIRAMGQQKCDRLAFGHVSSGRDLNIDHENLTEASFMQINANRTFCRTSVQNDIKTLIMSHQESGKPLYIAAHARARAHVMRMFSETWDNMTEAERALCPNKLGNVVVMGYAWQDSISSAGGVGELQAALQNPESADFKAIQQYVQTKGGQILADFDGDKSEGRAVFCRKYNDEIRDVVNSFRVRQFMYAVDCSIVVTEPSGRSTPDGVAPLSEFGAAANNGVQQSDTLPQG